MFRFYFQSGEFYGDQGLSWITVFKDLLIPLAGVGVPLLLFFLGFRQEQRRAEEQRMADRLKSDRIEDLRLLYFHSLLIESLKYCFHFRSVLNSIKGGLQANKYSSENLALDSDTDLKRIVVNLDRENLFYAYRIRIDDQSLSLIFKALDAVVGVRGTFDTAWSRATKEISNRKNQIASLTAKFALMIMDITPVDQADVELRKELMAVAIAAQEKPVDIHEYHQHLVDGIAVPFPLLIEKFNKTSDPQWNVIYSQSLEVQVLDGQVESIALSFSKIVDELNETLDRVHDDLVDHYGPLEDYLVSVKLLNVTETGRSH